MKKTFSVSVDASSKYPMRVVYMIEANRWHTAIAEAVRKWFKEHKHMRSERCTVNAFLIKTSNKSSVAESEE